MLRRRNDAFRGTPRELHGGAILFVQNYLLKLGCSRVVPSLILAGQARQFGEKNVLYKSYASSSKIQRQTETILWRFLECTRQKLIVPSPFIGRHHVVMHYMARWMDFPLPTPQPPCSQTPADSMTGGRQGQGRIDEQGRIDAITCAARDFALQLP